MCRCAIVGGRAVPPRAISCPNHVAPPTPWRVRCGRERPLLIRNCSSKRRKRNRSQSTASLESLLRGWTEDRRPGVESPWCAATRDQRPQPCCPPTATATVRERTPVPRSQSLAPATGRNGSASTGRILGGVVDPVPGKRPLQFGRVAEDVGLGTLFVGGREELRVLVLLHRPHRRRC